MLDTRVRINPINYVRVVANNNLYKLIIITIRYFLTKVFLFCLKRKRGRYMNLKYAIFRSEHIMTINDLAQIGSHNKREKKAYNSNPDIDIERTRDNIELVPLNEKYLKGFDNLTKEYKKEHEERMKTVRKKLMS